MREELGQAVDRSRGIVFDFDGTLFDIDVDWLALRASLDSMFPGLDFTNSGMLKGLNTLEEREGREGVERAFEVIFQFEAALPARPRREMITLARSAKAEGKRLAIFSANCRRTILQTLETHALKDIFETIVGGDDVVRRKPDPEGLLLAMAGCKVGCDETLYIADGDREMTTAEQAGVRCHILEKVR